MSHRDELLAAVAVLESTLRQSAQMGGETFKEHRKEVLQLRREISVKVADLYALGLAIEEGDRRNAFLREFSMMRSAMALHHASWPVVSVELENPDYCISVQSMREANKRFIDWIRLGRNAG